MSSCVETEAKEEENKETDTTNQGKMLTAATTTNQKAKPNESFQNIKQTTINLNQNMQAKLPTCHCGSGRGKEGENVHKR